MTTTLNTPLPADTIRSLFVQAITLELDAVAARGDSGNGRTVRRLRGAERDAFARAAATALGLPTPFAFSQTVAEAVAAAPARPTQLTGDRRAWTAAIGDDLFARFGWAA